MSGIGRDIDATFLKYEDTHQGSSVFEELLMKKKGGKIDPEVRE